MLYNPLSITGQGEIISHHHHQHGEQSVNQRQRNPSQARNENPIPSIQKIHLTVQGLLHQVLTCDEQDPLLHLVPLVDLDDDIREGDGLLAALGQDLDNGLVCCQAEIVPEEHLHPARSPSLLLAQELVVVLG